MEIASGQGDFLAILAEVSGCRALGFDPAYRGVADQGAGVEIIPEHFFDSRPRGCRPGHLPARPRAHAEPAEFCAGAATIAGHTAVYFEVPDAPYTLRGLGTWDLIYEHCGYFTRESLTHVFSGTGFRVDSLESAFGGQFLGLHGRAAAPSDQQPSPDRQGAGDLEGLGALVSAFAAAYRSKVVGYESRLAALADRAAAP